LLQKLVRAGREIRCFQTECFWLDIGRPEDFARAQEIYAKNPQIFLGGAG
jgi:NDP-sugar pyrophosphorylase family protein